MVELKTMMRSGVMRGARASSGGSSASASASRSGSSSVSASGSCSGRTMSGTSGLKGLKHNHSRRSIGSRVKGSRVERPSSTVKLSSSASTTTRCRTATLSVQACSAPATRTVAETKSDFLKSYAKPLGLLYTTAVNELLVQQHLMRFNVEYSYNSIFALGVVSVFDQLFSSLPEKDEIFDAYISSLCEEAGTYRADAEALTAAATQSKGQAISPITSQSTDIQKVLSEAKESIGKQHTKFLAIGMFRLLEITEITDKEALESLVKDLNCDFAKVTKDLTMYKGMLSKMEGAKELMIESVAREKKKDEERLKERKERELKKEEEEKTEASNPSASTA